VRPLSGSLENSEPEENRINHETSAKTKGDIFEDQVEAVFRMLGYKVMRNLEISGHQVDLVVEYPVPGSSVVRLAVECKYVTEGPLYKKDVIDNINNLLNLRLKNKVQHIMVVTTNSFSKELSYQQEENGVQLVTLRQLQSTALDFTPYLEDLVGAFDRDDFARYYVDLSGETVTRDASTGKETRMEYTPIDKYVSDWLKSPGRNVLVVLGEYGTGKTTLCAKLARDAANDILDGRRPNARLPILISLSDFSKTIDIESLITNQLVNKCGISNANFRVFRMLNEEGFLLLILDGFDEMAQRVDFDVTYSNFRNLMQLAKSKSKVLITCRTEYFRTYQNEREVLQAVEKEGSVETVYLKFLEEPQIQEYLQKRLSGSTDGLTWEYYGERINDIYDLRDLAQRPVLLNLIIRYLPRFIESKTKISASTLYDHLIDDELKREITKDRTVIRSEDRLELVEMLASWLYSANLPEVDYRRIPAALPLESKFGVRLAREIEWFLHDFLTCSFLHRVGPVGAYRFSHKSLLDYFVSRVLLKEISNGKPDVFNNKRIREEILNFLADRDFDTKVLRGWLTDVASDSSLRRGPLATNILEFLNLRREDLASLNLEGFELSGINLPLALLSNCNLKSSLLNNANLQGSNLTGTDLTKSSLIGSDFSNASLAKAKMINADLTNCRFGEMGAVLALEWSPDSKHLAAGGEDSVVRVWRMDSNEEVARLSGHSAPVTTLAWSPNGEFLATGGADGDLVIWETKRWRTIHRFNTLSSRVAGLAWSPDGKTLITVDGRILAHAFSVVTGRLVWSVKYPDLVGSGVVYAADGRRIVVGRVALGELESTTGKVMRVHETKPGGTLYMGRIFATRKIDRFVVLSNRLSIQIRDFARRSIPFSTSPIHGGVADFWPIADGNSVVFISGTTVGIVDMPSGTTTGPTATLSKMGCLAVDPFGRFVACGRHDASITILSLPELEVDRTIRKGIVCSGLNISGAIGLDMPVYDSAEGVQVNVGKFLVSRGATMGESHSSPQSTQTEPSSEQDLRTWIEQAWAKHDAKE